MTEKPLVDVKFAWTQGFLSGLALKSVIASRDLMRMASDEYRNPYRNPLYAWSYKCGVWVGVLMAK